MKAFVNVFFLLLSRASFSISKKVFIEILFESLQIDPDSRPSFKELEALLYYFIAESRPIVSPRKPKGTTETVNDSSLSRVVEFFRRVCRCLNGRVIKRPFS